MQSIHMDRILGIDSSRSPCYTLVPHSPQLWSRFRVVGIATSLQILGAENLIIRSVLEAAP